MNNHLLFYRQDTGLITSPLGEDAQRLLGMEGFGDGLAGSDPWFAKEEEQNQGLLAGALAHSAQALSPLHMDYPWRHPGGGLIWLRIDADPTRISDHGVVWHGTLKDITPQKEKEAEVIKVQSILDNAPYAVWLKDRSGRFLTVNKLFLDAAGLNRLEEVIGKTDYDLWPSDLADKYTAGDNLVFLQGRPRVTEEKALKHGIWYWVETYKAPLFDSEAQVMGLTGFSRDITERREREEDGRLSAAILNTVDEAILVLDASGKIVNANPAFSLISGFSREEVMGNHIRSIFSVSQKMVWTNMIQGALSRAGSWRGEVEHRKKNNALYFAEFSIKQIWGEDQKVTHQVVVFSDITERKAIEEKIRTMAHYDTLTGLPNRAMFDDRMGLALSQLKRADGPLALLFLDLNKFKPVNDNLGHEVGDQVLKEVAKRLLESVRESDTVARFGGDEFVVLLPSLHKVEDVLRAAHSIIKAISKEMVINGNAIHISTSIGVALAPQHGETAMELIKKADMAMYQSKGSGPGSVCIYSESSQTSTT